MKLTTGILAMAMMVGGAWAQNPDAIDTARSTAKSLQQKQANGTNPAPAAAAPAKAKPAPGAPAPAVKPATIPSSKPAPVAKPASAPKPVPVSSAQASTQHNQLKRVNVVPGADTVQIEISSTQPVTPRLTKLKSPDRVLVELPETVIASSQSKIPVGSAGVKGVRIGMDGKTPPTTSVVIDLEKPLAFELTPGSAGKVVLTLHPEGAAPSVAKAVPAAPVTAAAVPSAKAAPATAVKAVPVPAVKAAVSAPQPALAKPGVAPKVAVVKAPANPAVPATKPDAKVQGKASPATKIAPPASPAPVAVPVKTVEAPKPKEEKKWAMSGKRDPFFSPVVQQNGSGCSTGKKCLEIGAINLRGVVKSDSGFIAVVTNNLNKAYFLRENDPVFNGYVVKITGDSVVFQETIQDKLGKSFTREVVKRIFTPAV
jgi:Tfp pilus assembly protein PilP